MRTITRGVVAGAAATTALNAVTYLDMAVRARPPSSTPEQSVQRISDLAHVRLGEGEKAQNRKSGLGPLLGYATGVGVAVAYAYLVRGRNLPWPVEAAALTAMAMVAANAPMTVTGVTDPRRWSAAEWASDVVPHLAYGAAAAAVYERAGTANGRRRLRQLIRM
jgi:hypothetical protein